MMDTNGEVRARVRAAGKAPEGDGGLTDRRSIHYVRITRLNAFARSWFYNATGVAVQYRTSINQHERILSHSPGGGTTFQTPFSRYRLVKVSRKSVQPFPKTVVWYFCGGRKKNEKQKAIKKQKKTSVKHIRIRLIGGCVNNANIVGSSDRSDGYG